MFKVFWAYVGLRWMEGGELIPLLLASFLTRTCYCLTEDTFRRQSSKIQKTFWSAYFSKFLYKKGKIYCGRSGTSITLTSVCTAVRTKIIFSSVFFISLRNWHGFSCVLVNLQYGVLLITSGFFGNHFMVKFYYNDKCETFR